MITEWPSETIKPGDSVRLKNAPDRTGTVTNQLDGSPRRPRVYVNFDGEGPEPILFSNLEPVDDRPIGEYERFQRGLFGGVRHLRKEITYRRLSGKLANLIYSLNTTNTQFFPYQFKPVLQFLDSPSNGLLIADEVGLGKTIEAGLIWTELRAREDARRLLVVCPAMLREKWVEELANRFGVMAQCVDADELLTKLESIKARPHQDFALVASMQGLRPPRGFAQGNSKSGAAKLGRYLDGLDGDDPLLDLVIIDEAHYLRNESSQTNKLGQLLRPVASNLVLLSATPIQLRNKDLFNLLKLLDEDSFPYEHSFEDTLYANAPLKDLREKVLSGAATTEDFEEALNEAQWRSMFGESLQLEHLIENPPTADQLKDPKSRSELADQLDRINPLGKVITRTLKREVNENRVIRMPRAVVAPMSSVERVFYQQVTEVVREYCADNQLSTGFILTTPQRQMTSCMAAACLGWQANFNTMFGEDLDELLYELDGETEGDNEPPASMGELVKTLALVGKSIGSYESLKASDTKYNQLISVLKDYWAQYPDKKIILFAFYKGTLRYLHERLSEEGIGSLVLHGGMDKNEVIRQFRGDAQYNILLSSEVAAEGVDLQFSSVLINYDLPWNPMRIEQRIGRIDRIGQEEDRIHIWNMIYEDTIDQRVYDRLLDRLDIFRNAMGSMETILGDQVQALTKELLGHKLTPEQEVERIEQTAVALEKNRQDQARLEREADQLIAHGDFIQKKVRAARELGRYISGEDLYIYTRDFLNDRYPGSFLIQSENNPDWYRCELSTQARAEFGVFLKNHHLQGKTRLLEHSPPELFFDNQQARPLSSVERVTQDHPLIRFVTQTIENEGDAASEYPAHAISVPALVVPGIEPGIYVYTVARWSVGGAIDTEKLAYVVKRLDGETLDEESAEFLVNSSALKGDDWRSVKNEIDTEEVAELFDVARVELEDSFSEYRQQMIRANTDRVRMMVASLEKELKTKTARSEERINEYRQSGDPKKLKMIRPEEGKKAKLKTRLTDRIKEIQLREKLTVGKKSIAAGVVKVSA
ncbi:SNF2-related protein [Marinobacter nauticus]|uniref:Helicase domain protein n=1 Tax=Marinobacter nauticus (strain ATCC 700491 / DSM 11845 / VT8) TaxID=351348 RepID=A1U082_MARN8|nr:SNF2-related protein [Marinobacter nauticus]ABM18401.1 helicase domain protein [Marinobacter nauticus VT8]